MTAFEPDDRPGAMLEVVAGIRTVLAAQRAARHAAWGQPAPAALTARDEKVLTVVFNEASEPGDGGDEIAVAFADLQRLVRGQGALRVSLKRLVELGFLTQGRLGAVRTYSPTELAWAWAKANADRLAPPSSDGAPF
jgi:hypothetical protein